VTWQTKPKALWTVTPGLKPNGWTDKSKAVRRLKSRSVSYEKAMRIYRKRARLFLMRNPFCAVFKSQPSSQVHHSRGRLGALLLDERFWFAVSLAGHQWIDANRNEARKRGFLGPVGTWNNFEAAIRKIKANRGK